MKKSNKLKYLLTLLMILSISFSVFGINTSSIKAKASDGITAENLNYDKDTKTLTFKLNVNRKVKSGETLTIISTHPFPESGGSYSQSANTDIKLKDGTVIGYMYSETCKVHIVFNDKATTYETLSFDVTSSGGIIRTIYKAKGETADLTKDFTFDLAIDGDKISTTSGIIKDYKLLTYTDLDYTVNNIVNVYSNRVSHSVYFSKKANSGKVVVTAPDGMKINNTNFWAEDFIQNIQATDGYKAYQNRKNASDHINSLNQNKDKYLTLSSDGKKLTFDFNNAMAQDHYVFALNIDYTYQPGFSYQDNPTRKILVDYTGLNIPNLTTKELEIKKMGETTSANGFGTIKDVIPIVDTNTVKPDNYVTVTVDPKENGRLQDTVSQYYVTTKKQVSIPAKDPIANVGYTFNKWDTPLTNTFKSDTTISATYNKLNDIITVVDNNTTKPVGYVTVSFNKGDHGSLLGKTSYYVNPKANKKLNDLAPLPKIIPDTDYIFDKYSPIFNGDTIINKDMSFTAFYLYNKKVIEITPNNPNKPNDNYVRISFNATDMGHFEDNTTLKSYYVLKNITFKEAKDNGLLIPKAYYNDDTKSFDSYSPSLLNDNDLVIDCDYIATYTDNIKKIEPKDPSKPFNPKDTNDPNTPDITKGYKRLIFKSGIGGLLNGKDEVLVYDVKEDLTWAYINTKKLIPNIVSFKYFIFTNWDKNFPSDNTVLKDLSDNIFTAFYQELPKSSKPSVDPIADTDKLITGKGSPLSEIEIIFEDNTTITTKTDDKGNYQVKVDKPLKKDTKVIIIQKEDHKKPSDPTLTTVIHKNIKTLPNTGSNTTTNIMAYMMMIITTILLSLLLSFTSKQTSFKNK